MRGVGKSCKLEYRRIRWFSSRLEPTESVSAVNNKLKDLVSRQRYAETVKLYKEEIHPSGFHASTFILLPSIIKACSLAQFQDLGFQLHCVAQKSGADSDFVISNSLISMYAKFSSISSARKLFELMPDRDTITYNAMINCYTQYGVLFKTMEMLKEMIFCGFVPKPELIAGILSLCARKEASRIGKAVHGLAVVSGRTGTSVLMSTALVDMYLRCGETTVAFYLFGSMEVRNEVSWTAMISGCIINHSCDMAIDCFRAMQREGINPNRITLVTILSACEELGCVRLGKEIHCYVFRHGFEFDNNVTAALINMYCQRGCAMHPARLVFKLSEVKDVVMWTSIIGSCTRRGNCAEAMGHFNEMQREGFRPNSVTLLELTSVSTTLCSINHGDGVHCYIVKYGFMSDIVVGNALINMYAKCGCLRSSHQIFEEMLCKDSVSWSSMINAYGKHGSGEKALFLFNEMQERRMEMDAMTWLAVLSACNHSGLLKEGEELFNEALKDQKVSLKAEHYACYIDLLGRSGHINDACDALHKMAIKPNEKIWSSLVSACKVHGRSDIAEILGGELIKSEPENPASYALLSIIHAQSGNWMGAEEMRNVMKVQGLKKCYGSSRIELGS